VGFFKDLKKLNDQGRELRREHPVDEQMANAQARMANANALLAQQAAMAGAQGQAAADPAAVVGSARITAVHDTHMRFNLDPTLELDLLVALPGAAGHYPATVTTTVSMAFLARARAGESVAVRVNPATPQNVFVDWNTLVTS
jgi:hypothetical protein